MDKKPQMVEKENLVSELENLFSENDGVILADYRGLNVSEVTQLRSELRKAGVVYKVSKNTLLKRAANNKGIDMLDPYLEGPTAVAFAQDPVAMAKVLSDFAKEHKNLEMKAGLLSGQFLSAERVADLAKIPPREVLLAKLLGSMQSPLTGVAGCCNSMLRNFVYALDQIKEQKAQEA